MNPTTHLVPRRPLARVIRAVLTGLTLAPLLATAPGHAAPTPPLVPVPLATWANAVTSDDFGFDEFGGNAGLVSPPTITASARVDAPSSAGARLVLDWDFSADDDAYAGVFFCLEVCETKVRLGAADDEGQAISEAFREHALDLDRIDAPLRGPARGVQALRVHFDDIGPTPLVLRLEIKDVRCIGASTAGCGGRFVRLRVPAHGTALTWNFRDTFQRLGDRDLDLHRAKIVSIVVESRPSSGSAPNPVSGQLRLQRVDFMSASQPNTAPAAPAALLDEIERRALFFFVDSVCKTEACLGLPQDRSTFPDLLTTGGVGFSLPALIIGAERGWISRALARSYTLAVLEHLSNRRLFGSGAIGMVGYRGFLYHFLGTDGRRKLNFDFLATAQDESLNTVELSTIDTALAVMGALAAQSYFDGASRDERRIRALAQKVYDAVDWPFMLAPNKQWILGWKPLETRDSEPPFAIADRDGAGHYASRADGRLATLDYYTDEALIITLLAAGSNTHPIRAPKAVMCALIHDADDAGLVRSFPGALFTYQFLSTFIDPRTLQTARCPGDAAPINWFANTRRAIAGAMSWARQNVEGLPGYDFLNWVIDAAEAASGVYIARGAKPLRAPCAQAACASEEDGILTYYALGPALSLHVPGRPLRLADGTQVDLRANVLSVLRRAYARGHVHPRSGLPDAYAVDVARDFARNPQPAGREWIRTSGPWLQRANFAIDNGPLVLGLENARSHLVWDLLARNPNVKRALARLR